MSLTLSTDVGRPLTPAEIDANFQFVYAAATAQKSQADSSATAASTSAAQALAAAPVAAATAAAQAVTNVIAAVGATFNATLLAWAYASAFQLVAATRDANGTIITASIVWPDGATGAFMTDAVSTAFPGAIDAWHATYVNGATTKTVTQPAVSRDTNGAVAAQPTITIA